MLLCFALVCAFAPALAFADAEDVSSPTLRTAVIAGEDDVETVGIGVLPVPAVGSKHVVNGSTYKVTSSKSKTVSFYRSKNASKVTVPSTVRLNGYTFRVTRIAPSAFSTAKTKVKVVSIGKNVSIIGKKAFRNCAKLVYVKGGANVKTIGVQVFVGCKNMKSCAPFSSKKLVRVGTKAFSGAKKFKTVTVKSKLLKSKDMKNSLTASSVGVVKVNVGSEAVNKKYVKKYKTVFAEKNSGFLVGVGFFGRV